jgi:hypothetical protein
VAALMPDLNYTRATHRRAGLNDKLSRRRRMDGHLASLPVQARGAEVTAEAQGLKFRAVWKPVSMGRLLMNLSRMSANDCGFLAAGSFTYSFLFSST